MKKNHNIVTLEATLLRETEKAYGFDSGKVDEHKRAVAIWIPKSQCEWDGKELDLPEWLALERGLI